VKQSEKKKKKTNITWRSVSESVPLYKSFTCTYSSESIGMTYYLSRTNKNIIALHLLQIIY